MANATPQSYLSFLTADWCSTEFLTFRLAERLVAVAVTDRAEDGLSAVYTFFEPELATRSLGTSAILHQIELARTLGLPYLYLGYWIRDSRKMAYKASFRPIELWRNGHWQRLAVGDDPPG
jgi:arginine-tRNA-protein transferase